MTQFFNDPSCIVSYREQIKIRNSWLEKRLKDLLPQLMINNDLDCWIVMAREYNEDPVIMSLLPASMLSCRRTTILLFKLEADMTLSSYSLSRPGTKIDHLYKGIWTNPKGQNWDDLDIMPYTTESDVVYDQPETQMECLVRILNQLNPKKIGLNYSVEFAFGDGLSLSLYKQFMNHLTPSLKEKVVSTEKLCINWLETRIPEEMVTYNGIVQIAHGIIEEAFSNRVILPGVTSNSDVKYFMMQKVIDLNMTPWFDYEVSIIRQGVGHIGHEAIILPGDILHCDIGLKYLGLCTDTQHNAYVCKLDECDAPKGIQQLQKDLNLLQDITIRNFSEGRTGNKVLDISRNQAIEEGLEPCIYTHPIGYHGHGAGPTVGLWDMQEGVPGKGDYSINNNTLYALELNITSSIPEWDNQSVTLGAETNILFRDDECAYLASRQEMLHIIK